MKKEALFYVKKEKDLIKCILCPHECLIKPGNTGICRVRFNNQGKLTSLNYGKCTAVNLDSIEKKPLRDFYPGTKILSLGSYGCNFKCSFCQNWQISQMRSPSALEFSSVQVAEIAKQKEENNNIGIAYTYSEPLMWYEFVLETAQAIKKIKMKNVLVTNGYINEEPLKELVKYIDAANIDIKGFNNKFYSQLCKATLLPVLKTVELMAASCHIEITNLIIPGYNDNLKEIEKLAIWISSISKDISLHLTRYFPSYQLNAPVTSIETLEKAQEIAQKYLNKVYIGNI